MAEVLVKCQETFKLHAHFIIRFPWLSSNTHHPLNEFEEKSIHDVLGRQIDTDNFE